MLTADLERRIEAFENKCFRRMFALSWHIWQHINILTGRPELLLSTVKRRKFSWFGHVCRHDIRCQRSYYREQRMVFVAEDERVSHGRATSNNGQASRCCHCCASMRITEVNRSAVVAADASVEVPPTTLGVTGISKFCS